MGRRDTDIQGATRLHHALVSVVLIIRPASLENKQNINDEVRDSADITNAGTTTFVDPATIVKNDTLTNMGNAMLAPIRDQTLADFLAKPQQVATGSWSTSDTAGTILVSSTVATDLQAQTLWTNKLKGFNFFRAKAVYRVVFNATPFHQGLIKFGFVPFIGSTLGSGSEANTWRENFLASYSTVPGVMVDVRESAAIMEIPFVAPVDYYGVTNTVFAEWGKWSLKVYSPLDVGASGASTIDYTVYLHFVDCEFAAPIHPQMPSGPIKKAYKPNKSKTSVTTKVGLVAKEEIAESKPGLISRGLGVAADVADYCGEIPILSSIAGPAAWVLRHASSIAAWFGYSKPYYPEKPTLVSSNFDNNFANATGSSVGPTLALYHDNAISIRDDLGAVDHDEMSFDYIKSIPGYVGQINWSTTDIQDSLISTISVGPAQLYNTDSYDSLQSATLRFWPPFSYIRQFFNVYRGSIDLHFKIVKTDFHSGRLAFSFVPRSSASTPSISETAYLLREIVDVRDRSEIVIRIPYLHTPRYLDVNEMLGKLYIHVLNELRAPETCSNNIKLLYFASAGPDFEYAIPGKCKADGAMQPVVPQIGDSSVVLSTDQSIVQEPIGNYPVMQPTDEPACSSIGEKFTSVRQLLQKFSLMSTASAATTTSTSYVGLYPHTVAIPKLNTDSSSVYLPPITYDALCRLAYGFAFMRGSVKIALLPSDNGSSEPWECIDSQFARADASTVFSTSLSIGYQGANYNYTTQSVGNESMPFATIDSVVGNFEARVPYNCRTVCTAILPRSADSVPADFSSPYNYLAVRQMASTNKAVRVFRSIGEDFQLTYFLGFPPTFVEWVV